MAQKPKEDKKGYASQISKQFLLISEQPIAFAAVFLFVFILQLGTIEDGLQGNSEYGLISILTGLLVGAFLLGWLGAAIASELKKRVTKFIGLDATGDGLIKPSELRDISVGILKIWWTWIIAVAGIGLFWNAYKQEWNFPWLPLGVALFMFGYGIYKTLEHRNSVIQHYEYMIKYGLKRQAMMFKCNLCGAVFHQPEGADLCPECYESGIVEIEV
jgi:hypothetical protein